MVTKDATRSAYLGVVGAVVSFGQPRRLGIRNLAQLADDLSGNNALLIGDNTNLQALVLGLLENFVPVETVERLSGILASW